MSSGIYKIVNNVNGKVYIGSTKNFDKRKQQHFYTLSQKKHHSPKLQRSYNKHGKESFEFQIVEEC